MKPLINPGYQSMYLLLICSLLSSCMMEKRIYRPGYYVESNNRQLNIPISELRKEPFKEAYMIPVLTANQIEIINEKQVAPEFAIFKASIVDPQNFKNEKKRHPDSENNCTQLILYDDRVIDVILVEVGRKKVLYKVCEQPDSEVLSITSDLVYKIRYTNGTEYILNEYTKANTGKDVLKLSLVLGIAILVLLLLITMVIYRDGFFGDSKFGI